MMIYISGKSTHFNILTVKKIDLLKNYSIFNFFTNLTFIYFLNFYHIKNIFFYFDLVILNLNQIFFFLPIVNILMERFCKYGWSKDNLFSLLYRIQLIYIFSFVSIYNCQNILFCFLLYYSFI